MERHSTQTVFMYNVMFYYYYYFDIRFSFWFCSFDFIVNSTNLTQPLAFHQFECRKTVQYHVKYERHHW